jgi:hypothetical protein
MRTARLLLLAAMACFCASGSASAASSYVHFLSPSHNIGCYLTKDQARCDVLERDWTIPRPKGCPTDLDYGFGATLTPRGRARSGCASDSALGTGPTLRYGKSISRFGFTCSSSEAGIRCRNRAGHGFLLSRQRYRLY